MTITINITDDHPMVVSGLRFMLSASPGIEVTATYHNGEDLLKGLEQNLPDVLLLDIQMPGMSGNELARIISKKYPSLGIIAVTSLDSAFHVNDMLKHGCLGYILKNTELPVLEKAIRTVYAGKQFVDESLSRKNHPSDRPRMQPDVRLTGREKQMLSLIAAGLTTSEMAEKLFLSIRTIESHRYNLMQKMKAKNMAEMIKFGMEMGLV